MAGLSFPGKAPTLVFCEFILSASPVLWGNLILCNASKRFSAGVKPLFHRLPAHSRVLISCQYSSTIVVPLGFSNLRSPHISHNISYLCLLSLSPPPNLDHIPPEGKMLPSGCWMGANPGFPQRHTDIFCSAFHSSSNNSFQVLDREVIRDMTSEAICCILLRNPFI